MHKQLPARGTDWEALREQMIELGKGDEPDANDQHIVRVVDWLLQYAFEQRASDIHLEPRREAGGRRACQALSLAKRAWQARLRRISSTTS